MIFIFCPPFYNPFSSCPLLFPSYLPVSYTHLDVYKRQLQTPPSMYFIYNNPFPSSIPSIMFMFWMAAPDAPLPRLSYVATSRM